MPPRALLLRANLGTIITGDREYFGKVTGKSKLQKFKDEKIKEIQEFLRKGDRKRN